jgi:hypothetical protein
MSKGEIMAITTDNLLLKGMKGVIDGKLEVFKATATRHLQDLVAHRILKSNKGKGAGAHYIIGSRMK